MVYEEIVGDLFKVPHITEDVNGYFYVHCIASVYRMGAGIAVPMNRKFDLKGTFKLMPKEYFEYPTCINTDGVLNMITKPLSHGKPRYEDFISSLRDVRRYVKICGIPKIALPQIGCGIDGLSWAVVSALLKDFFKDMDIEIKVVLWEPNN